MNFRIILLLFHLLLVLATWETPVAAAEKKAPPPHPLALRQLPEFRISRGAVLYQRYCTFCHGDSGQGDGLNAYMLPVKPADLGDQQLLAAKSEKEMVQIILQGGKATGLSSAMPSFAQTLTPAQAGFLVDHIRTTIKHAPAAESDDSGL